MSDRLEDVLMAMGLKAFLRNSGSDLVLVVRAFMRVTAIDFDRIRREANMIDVYHYYSFENGKVLLEPKDRAREMCHV